MVYTFKRHQVQLHDDYTQIATTWNVGRESGFDSSRELALQQKQQHNYNVR